MSRRLTGLKSARKPSPLRQLAAQIDAHLKRMEADPTINVKVHDLQWLYHAGCAYSGGSKIHVRYRSFQSLSYLTRAEAEEYLAALDRGVQQRHHEVLREQTRTHD